MPGQDRIERMLREVWQRCRVRFEHELRPFEIALGECLNALFKDSTNWPERWSGFVAEWQARGVVVSDRSQRVIEELLGIVARKRPIPRDPSGRYFAPTKLAQSAAPPANNAASPNWPALTKPQREQIQNESGLAWWYPIQPVVPGDQYWEYQLAGKARAARDKLLDFFLALQALGALANAEGEESDDGLEAIQNQSAHVREAYDNYVASYIALQQRWLLYLQYQPFLGMYVAGLMRKVDAGLPPSVLGLHSKYERELMEVQAEVAKASNSLSNRVDVTYTVAVWTDRAITVIEAATFFLSAGAVVKTALTKALAAGATRAAAVNLAIRAGIKQVVVQAVRQLAIGAVLPEVLIACGLDEKQVRQGLVLLDAAPMLLNLRTLKVELSRPAPQPRKDPPPLQVGAGDSGLPKIPAHEITEVQVATGTVPNRRGADTANGPPRKNALAQFWTKIIEFQGIKVYQRTDLIDPNLKDKYGRTNLQRMELGRAPIGPDGESLTMHHMLQMQDGPVAETTMTFHRTKSKIIHVNPSTIPSGIERAPFDAWRRDYWMNRAKDFSEDAP